MISTIRIIQILLYGIVLISLSSCVTLPGYQNASTTPMGERAWMFGTSYQSVEIRRDSMDDKTVVTPLFVLARRKGLTQRVDYGTYFSSGAEFFADIKYRLLGSNLEGPALAFGLGVGTTGYVGPNASYRVIAPLYTSWQLSDRLGFYFSPQASIAWSNREDGFIETLIFTGGVELGNRKRFVMNFSFANDLGTEEGVGRAYDIGIAYKFAGRKKAIFLPAFE